MSLSVLKDCIRGKVEADAGGVTVEGERERRHMCRSGRAR